MSAPTYAIIKSCCTSGTFDLVWPSVLHRPRSWFRAELTIDERLTRALRPSCVSYCALTQRPGEIYTSLYAVPWVAGNAHGPRSAMPRPGRAQTTAAQFRRELRLGPNCMHNVCGKRCTGLNWTGTCRIWYLSCGSGTSLGRLLSAGSVHCDVPARSLR